MSKFKSGDKVKIVSLSNSSIGVAEYTIGDFATIVCLNDCFLNNDLWIKLENGSEYGISSEDVELIFETNKEYDVVNKPKHYNSDPSGVQCIELTRCLSSDAANALKYIWRDGKKDETLQERKKAQWYVNDLIEYDVPIAIEGLGDTIEFEDKVKKVLSTWSGWKYIFLNALYLNDKQEMKRAIDALVKEAETNS